LPKLPPGSERSLEDPFAEKKSPWPKLIVFAILLIIAYKVLDNRGLINKWTGCSFFTKVEETTPANANTGGSNAIATASGSLTNAVAK
jgi:hypothetical protein